MSSDNTPDPGAAAPRQRPARGGFPVLSLLALLVALLTAGYVIYRDPPWGRLSKYDFSGPEQAMRSDMRMEANGDIHALIELNAALDRKQLKEKLNSLEVKRTAEFDGKTALFIQYKSTDKKAKKEEERKEVVWYEKEEGSGYWRRTYVSPMEVQEKDKKLAEEINAWSRSGLGGMPGIGGID